MNKKKQKNFIHLLLASLPPLAGGAGGGALPTTLSPVILNEANNPRLHAQTTLPVAPQRQLCHSYPMESPLPPWRRALHHATTLLLIALYSAFAAPAIATMLMALRTSGLTAELPAALILVPLTILFAGPAAFALGLVLGWMLLVLATNGINNLAARTATAALIATTVWWLAEPLPNGTTSETTNSALSDWLIWTATAILTALMFTRRWIARRIED